MLVSLMLNGYELICNQEESVDIILKLDSIFYEIFTYQSFCSFTFLQNSITPVRTNIKRLIRIYDYLKWGKH